MGSPAPDEPTVPAEPLSGPAPVTPSSRPSGGSMLERLRHRLELINEWFEASGVSLHGVNFGLVWWKKAGLRWTIAAFLAVGFPTGYASLGYMAANAVPDWVGDFGVRFEAADWDYEFLAMNAVARNVTVRRDDRSQPVFTASEVVFDGSLWSALRGFFSPGASYNAITVRKGEVRVERSLVGGVNWLEFLEAVPADRRDAAVAGLYRIKEVYLEDMRVVYTEHVPGDSGSGVIQTTQATVFVEGVTGEIFDLIPPDTPDDRPTRFRLNGRSADGIVEIKGTAGLFGAGGATPAAGTQNASVVPRMPVSTNGSASRGPAASEPSGAATTLEGPYYKVDVYLGHVGMAAFQQMVPTTRLVSTAGTLQGTLGIDRTPAAFTCTADLQIQGARFAPSRRPDVTPAQYQAIQRDLIGFEVSDKVTSCGSSNAQTHRASVTTTGASTSSLSAVMAGLNAQATRSAPASVRVFAAMDQQDLAGVAFDATMNEITRQVARRLGLPMPQAIDPRTGRPIPAQLNGNDAGNPVARGLRSIGGGLKRLFGGGGGDRRNDNPKTSGSKAGGS